MNTSDPSTQSITLGGGCFWCTEAVFLQVRGVLAVESGYCNGQMLNPSYEDICTGETGHAEVVQVSFDPGVIGLEDIFNIFMGTHDPTSLNRQGNDEGTQYRSGIYTHSPEQYAVASAYLADAKAKAQGWFAKPIVTELAARSNYSRAEDYHQNYFARNPNQGYCAFVVGPKVAKFQKAFAQFLKP
jgi:peptide-methionine (S)-S-oxide reductase